jgi:hypothetical protein
MNLKQQNILKQLAQMGEVVYVKKDGSRVLLNEEGAVPLATQADAVMYFLQRLDVDMLKLVLEEATYQDFDKRTFLRKLSYTLESFLEKGDTYLNVYPGTCVSTACDNASCLGYSFIGNKTANYMDLIFDVKADKVKDIYECFHFMNSDDGVIKKAQVLIDDDPLFE